MKRVLMLTLLLISLFTVSTFADTKNGINYTEYKDVAKAQRARAECMVKMRSESNVLVIFPGNITEKSAREKFYSTDLTGSARIDYYQYVLRDGISNLYSTSTKFETINGKKCLRVRTVKKTDKNAKALEAKMKKGDKLIKQRVTALKLSGKSEFEKARIIYNWVTNNIKYNKKYQRISNSYDTIINKQAVCRGYTLLMCRMFDEAGMASRYISGFTTESHSWNMIRINGKWYQADATFDKGRIRGAWNYFLRGSSDMKGHTIKKKQANTIWPLQKKQHPIAAKIYVPAPKITRAYKTKKSVTKVNWTKSKGASGYQIAWRPKNSTKWRIATFSGSKLSGSIKVGNHKICFYKIRAYKKVNGKTYYSKKF